MAWESLVGAGLSAMGNIAGGLLGSSSAANANKMAEAQYDKEYEWREKAAQNAVYWRVQDAKRAGVHPLAALGATLHGSSPISVGGGVVDNSLGRGLAGAGQDIGRAIASMSTEDKKVAAQRDALNAAMLSKTQAEIDYIRSMTVRNLESSMSMPNVSYENRMMPGQGNSPLVKMQPQTVTRSGRSGTEPSQIHGVGHMTMPDGSVQPIKSKQATEQLEDDTFGNIKHFFARTFGPMFNPGAWRPNENARPGHKWYVDWKGDYIQVPIAPNDMWRRGRHPSQR